MNQYWCRGYYVDTVGPSRRTLTKDPEKARSSQTLNTQNKKLCFCQRMEMQLCFTGGTSEIAKSLKNYY